LVRGLYAAAAGALVAQAKADTIANNLANVNTAGFKNTLMQIQASVPFAIYRIQTDPGQTPGRATPGIATQQYVGPLGTGALVEDTPTGYEQGALQKTNNPLDLALGGPGFFTIQTAQGVRYTRDGEFVTTAQGVLETQDGDQVLGTNGQPIVIPPSNDPATFRVSISSDGAVSQGANRLGQIAITQFGNLTALRPEGANRFVDTGGANPAPDTTTSINQGFLEASNANVVRSMVSLIDAERWFEANQNMIEAEDKATGIAITTVGHNSST